MIDIDFTVYHPNLQVKRESEKRWIFDPIRRKWLVLQPEELVRQLIIQYLLEEKGYNKNRIQVEKQLIFNALSKRCDLVVYDQDFKPWMIVECKAPQVKIDDKVFHQIITYNMELQVDYLVLSNGIQTYCAAVDYQKGTYDFVAKLPTYNEQ
jgi:hypothetical protein